MLFYFENIVKKICLTVDQTKNEMWRDRLTASSENDDLHYGCNLHITMRWRSDFLCLNLEKNDVVNQSIENEI
jgi:hypothetical protein